MILGLGTDIVDIARIQKILDGPQGSRFIERIFTFEERQAFKHYSGRRKSEFISGRYAAKEAVVKALGLGFGKQICFQDIEVSANAQGKPSCSLSARVKQILAWPHENSYTFFVTISHERALAVATAVLEKG